jgi:RNA polymerase sigma-70 factor, ECF subfamily
MTALETDVTAGNFADSTRRAEHELGPRTKGRHDLALFIEGRTGCPFDVSTKSVEGGEATTVKELYDEHAAALWRYAWRLTGDRVRAQDVVQETLLRAWQHPEVAHDSERSARAWLFTVARNMIIDESRSVRFRREVNTLDVTGAPERVCPDEVNAALDRLLIAEALARLTPEHRAVVTRSYLQGWTTAQIGADLGIADGTVKSRLHYALRALRLALQEMGVTP